MAVELKDLLGIPKAGVFSITYTTVHKANAYARGDKKDKAGRSMPDKTKPTPANLTEITLEKSAVVNLSKQSYSALVSAGKIHRTADEVAHAAAWNKEHTQWFKHYTDANGEVSPFVYVGNTPATEKQYGLVVYKLDNTQGEIQETKTLSITDASGASMSPEQYAIWLATYGQKKAPTDVFVIKAENIKELKHGNIVLK